MAKIGAYYFVPPDEWFFAAHPDVQDALKRADEYFTLHGDLNEAHAEIEEFVRQWALRQLIDVYRYPREWLGERLVIEEPVKMGSTEKEADIAIKNASRRTFVFIEVKKANISNIEFSEAERQLESYLAATHTATIGMVTDGVRTRVLRKKIDPNDFDLIGDIPPYGLELRVQTQLVRELPDLSSGRKTGLKPLGAETNRILFDCHSAVRDIDGLHADEALDEICKALYAKIFDERLATKRDIGEAFRFQIFGASSASEVASNIRTLYEEAKAAEVELYTKRIPNYERSRGVFKQQLRLSDSAVFAVAERLQEFSLIDSSVDIKGAAFQRILGPAIRAGMGQYFTPDPIVELAVGILAPRAADLILDPFCGSGHFLSRSLGYVMDRQAGAMTEHDLHEFKFFHLHGIEKSDRMVRIAMTDMLLHDDGHTNIRNQDALLSFDNYPDIIALRDDGSSDPAVFDIVLTNPPFGSVMRTEAMEMLGRFALGHKKKSLPLEILGLERSLQFLKPGGKLGIVLPEHILKGKSGQFVRHWLYAVAELKAFISLPEDAFTPYGAMVKTALCVFRKLRSREKPNLEAVAFLCEIENIGFDATGRPQLGSEVASVIAAFHDEVGWEADLV